MLKEFRPALILLMALSILTGMLYPALVTGLAKVAFPNASNGSLLESDGKIVGSRLIGQHFSDPKHFWGRPSATSPMPYNAASSGGSNQGPLNPALEDAVKERIEALKASDPTQTAPIPVDLVTASASGLDPHISVAAALWQVPRIARRAASFRAGSQDSGHCPNRGSPVGLPRRTPGQCPGTEPAPGQSCK
jgi:K+-transporting ATPase ATPase C chain